MKWEKRGELEFNITSSFENVKRGSNKMIFRRFAKLGIMKVSQFLRGKRWGSPSSDFRRCISRVGRVPFFSRLTAWPLSFPLCL